MAGDTPVDIFPPAHNGDGTATGVVKVYGSGQYPQTVTVWRDIAFWPDEQVAVAEGLDNGHKILPTFKVATPGNYYTRLSEIYPCESHRVPL